MKTLLKSLIITRSLLLCVLGGMILVLTTLSLLRLKLIIVPIEYNYKDMIEVEYKNKLYEKYYISSDALIQELFDNGMNTICDTTYRKYLRDKDSIEFNIRGCIADYNIEVVNQ